MSDLLQIEQGETVTRFTLNRADKHNALSTEMMTRFAQGIEDLSTPIAVIAANGTKTFCAGADLGERGLGEDFAARQSEALLRLVMAMARSPSLIIALPFGRVMGGGGLLTILADIVLARDDMKLNFPEIQFKMFPTAIHAALLERVSPAMAWQLCASGITLNANDSFTQGLATQIIPAATFAQDSDRLIEWYSERAEILGKAKSDYGVIDAERIAARLA